MDSNKLEGLQAKADHWLVACVELYSFIHDAPEKIKLIKIHCELINFTVYQC